MIAEVVINVAAKELNRVFDYNIPENLLSDVRIGSRVLLPFGHKKTLEEGFVIGFKTESEYKVKDIQKVEDNYLTKSNIDLAKWMAKRYFCNISDCIKLMLPPGTATKNIESRVKDKNINIVYLKKDFDEIEADIENKKIKSDKHIRALNFIKENEGSEIAEIEIFADVSRDIIKRLEKNGYVDIVEKKVDRNPFINKDIERKEKLKLTDEQQNAYSQVVESIYNKIYSEFLLYGITGSGKTEVYLQLIEKVLSEGKSAIMLVPEISLTPQMVYRFIERFGNDEIAVLHSKLSVGERYDAWNRIKEGKAKVVIGARSAIFAPMQNLGLIIIDEEHDSSYKSEMQPRYDAKEISRRLAENTKIPLVLGSATPDINTFYKAQNGEIQLLELTKRANDSNLPEVQVVDLKQELACGNRSMISVALYKEIENNIKNRHQTVLFLNRRGYSTFIMCRNCGYTAKCRNCNISLTYHQRANKLKCHYCGYEQSVLTICPECQSDKIRYFGTGTQKLEVEINRMFPMAKTIRMDVDTVTKKNSHEEILNKFKNENIDILIGTQMVVKGHHFPKVTLVGVIAADGSLNIDDYRANERTFQILTQVAGRAGRENLPGKVIVQTYNPENFIIELSKKQDYNEFYNTEVALREQLNYPPFTNIAIIGFTGINEQEIKKVSGLMYQELIKNSLEKKIFKPMPCPIDRIKNKYRWRIIVKGVFDEEYIEYLNDLLNKVYDINLKETRVVIDLNPNSMM